MIVLALDTALSACSAAVLDGERVLAIRSEPMERGHQERLAPLVAEVMAEAGIGFERLDRVGVTIGPGSFTGLRVGLAFAKGLSLALDIPCSGVGTLAALAASAGASGLIAAVIDAKRGQVYFQAFRDGASLDKPAVLEIAEAASRLSSLGFGAGAVLTGSGAPLLAEAAPDARIDSRAALDPAALARLTAAAPVPASRPRPLYLRPPDARTIAERAAKA